MSQICREYPLRAGRIFVRGLKARRDASAALHADYALFFKTNIPLAVVEAMVARELRRLCVNLRQPLDRSSATQTAPADAMIDEALAA